MATDELRRVFLLLARRALICMAVARLRRLRPTSPYMAGARVGAMHRLIWQARAFAPYISDAAEAYAVEAEVVRLLAATYVSLGDHVEAATCHGASLALAQGAADKHAEAAALCNLGASAQAAGEFEAASAYLLGAISVGEEGGDWPAQALALGNLGLVMESLGQLSQVRNGCRRTGAMRNGC